MEENIYYIDRGIVECLSKNFTGCEIRFRTVPDLNSFMDRVLSLNTQYIHYDNLFIVRSGIRGVHVISDKTFGFHKKYTKYSLGVRGMKTGLFGGSEFRLLDLSTIDTSKLENSTALFADCKIDRLNIRSLKNAKLKDVHEMFSHSTFGYIDGINELNTGGIVNMSKMFYKTILDFDLDLSNFDTSNCNNFDQMFESCNTHKINVSSFYINKKAKYRRMFAACKAEVSALQNFEEILTIWDEFSHQHL